MFKENNALREVSQRNDPKNSDDLSYQELSYVDLSPETKKRFDEKRKKELGFSYIAGGEKSSLLISSAHAADLAKTNLEVSNEDLEAINDAEDVKKRYRRDENGNLLVGKTYLNAATRKKRSDAYKADSGAAALGIELQDELSNDTEKSPSLLLYEIPQVFSEPNKIDAQDRSLPVVDLGIYEENGMQKMKAYILEKGVDTISSGEIMSVKRGQYSEMAENEQDKEKRRALLECEEVIKSSKSDKEKYRKISAALGVLKIHRSYYEKQNELLYANTENRFPTNLELHTAYNELKEEEGFDIVIGSKLGSSVSDPEVELLLSVILRKHGFVVNMSTFNNFPTNITERERKGLKKTLEVSELYLEDTQKDFYKEAREVVSREELLGKFEAVIDQRIDGFDGNEDVLIRFVQWKGMAMLLDENETFEGLKSLTKEIFIQELSVLSDGDLKLLLQQNLLSLLLSGKVHDDRLRGGLTGLSSLHSKFDSKDKYEEESGLDIRPQIMQIETASSVMQNKEKRGKLKDALAEFGEVIQSEDFNPKEVLNNII